MSKQCTSPSVQTLSVETHLYKHSQLKMIVQQRYHYDSIPMACKLFPVSAVFPTSECTNQQLSNAYWNKRGKRAVKSVAL